MKKSLKLTLFAITLGLFFVVTAVVANHVSSNLLKGIDGSRMIVDVFHFKISSFANMFLNKSSKYSVNYPDNWQASYANGIAFINGQDYTPSFNSTVNIQTIKTKKLGGKYSNVHSFMADVKKQIQHNHNAKIISDGKIEIVQPNGKTAYGEFLVFSFNNSGMMMKQWQIIIRRDDGKVFYTWAYTSPYPQFNRDLQSAKVTLDTWYIYQ